MTPLMTHLLDIPSIFSTASREADDIQRLTIYFVVVASAILLTVVGLLIYIVVRFRAKPGEESEPKQFTGNKTVESIMIGIPTLLVIIFFVLSAKAMRAILPPTNGHKPDIIIRGHQFWWEAQYPGTRAVVANEIHLPVGRPLLLHIEAKDVIHNWWVPELGTKMDAIPGRTNYLWLNIEKPGVYEGACSEFCGAQHAWMRIRVIAEPEDQYQRWLADYQRQAVKPASESARTGAQFFNTHACVNCHRIQGTVANGQGGPDLTHFASRKTMLSGMMPNNRDNLHKWLDNPQHVKPGALMPRFVFPEDSINVLVDYLSTLK